MSDPWFFGYGSLVNARTHQYRPTAHAELFGWRRAWRATPDRDLAFLTVIEDPNSRIKGLIAPVPGADWAALDAREAAYERHPAANIIHHQHRASTVAVYAIAPHRLASPSPNHPILLSYLDAVIQGHLVEFGAEGAHAFFTDTLGWDAPILDDRAAPRYPRAQDLTSSESGFVDRKLVELGCTILSGA